MTDFAPRLALASLSGESDADWAQAGGEHADAAVLGGIALDSPSRAAARKLVARGRSEFLPREPAAFVDRQLASLEDAPIRAGINVRSATPDPLEEVARICEDRGAFLEINAHCRQDELRAVGCGESLLADTPRLAEYVRTATEAADVPVGVKVRTEVPGVDLPALAGVLEDAGASYLHVDAMDSEGLVADVRAACGLYLIANNGVRGREAVAEYRSYGADAVSVGRPSDDPTVLARVREAVDREFDPEGIEPPAEPEP
ncbi:MULTISPECIES: tRNA-dihydrouridine synthase [Saliphagus]|uniref:tRNA-dihydrouridine synthase n=1 Tax=Saliphagus infecundisoli TaxID=1849069 RepID=A0ABD5QFB3_9EURY|nr:MULTISPECIES: tRNA-dihydrouridine synthase [Saliphagus]